MVEDPDSLEEEEDDNESKIEPKIETIKTLPDANPEIAAEEKEEKSAKAKKEVDTIKKDPRKLAAKAEIMYKWKPNTGLNVTIDRKSSSLTTWRITQETCTKY